MMPNIYILLLVFTTLAVVLSRRTMYSILFLILLFAMMALVVLSLKIDFIGLIFVIVYVGAIATLFLFIIMMLGGEDWASTPAMDVGTYHLLLGNGYRSNGLLSLAAKALGYFKHAVLDIGIALLMALALVELFSAEFTGRLSSGLEVSNVDYASSLFNNVYLYGVFFYNHWYLPFLAAAVVLLVAMLGSIILTTRLIVVAAKPTRTFSLIGFVVGFLAVAILVYFTSSDADSVLCEPQKLDGSEPTSQPHVSDSTVPHVFNYNARLYEQHLKWKVTDPEYGDTSNYRFGAYPGIIGLSYVGMISAPLMTDDPKVIAVSTVAYFGIIYTMTFLNYLEFYEDL